MEIFELIKERVEKVSIIRLIAFFFMSLVLFLISTYFWFSISGSPWFLKYLPSVLSSLVLLVNVFLIFKYKKNVIGDLSKELAAEVIYTFLLLLLISVNIVFAMAFYEAQLSIFSIALLCLSLFVWLIKGWKHRFFFLLIILVVAVLIVEFLG